MKKLRLVKSNSFLLAPVRAILFNRFVVTLFLSILNSTERRKVSYCKILTRELSEIKYLYIHKGYNITVATLSETFEKEMEEKYGE